MNILFIGDICGRPGRSALKKVLVELKDEFQTDLVIANIENASSGKGVTEENYRDLKALGIDCFTSGNHIWSQKEAVPILENSREILIRPANFPPATPGRGVWTGHFGSTKVAVMNLMGRVFMRDLLDDPFRLADALIKEYENHLIMIDFHAETTSEKRAFGFYVDGRVAAVIGTHTHVPTADAQILPKGTAYITDVGFVGPQQSVLGVDKDIIIQNFLTSRGEKHDIASGDAELGAVIMKSEGLKITSIEHIRRIVEL